MYGTFAGTWYFAPASKSVAARATGGAMPWYLRRRSHQCWLYCSGLTAPENTSQRQRSTLSAHGRNAILSSALSIWRLSVTLSLLTTSFSRPFALWYAGVIDRSE